ncbi:MAG: hypothetical protein LBS11_09825 [Oscillospiraceae bacterium]|jgi:hypothetical protein|nr:hypothetical protein [Oscillospiraceae bacterium]
MTGYGLYTPVLKNRMEGNLMKRIHSIAIRVTKAECLDLPDVTDIIQHVDLETAALRLYRDLVKESYAELGRGEVTATNILTKLLRLSQLTGGFLTDDGGRPQRVSEAKMKALTEIIASCVNEGKKLVVIARFIP